MCDCSHSNENMKKILNFIASTQSLRTTHSPGMETKGKFYSISPISISTSFSKLQIDGISHSFTFDIAMNGVEWRVKKKRNMFIFALSWTMKAKPLIRILCDIIFLFFCL